MACTSVRKPAGPHQDSRPPWLSTAPTVHPPTPDTSDQRRAWGWCLPLLGSWSCHSCVLLLVRGFRFLAFLFERLFESVKACFPEFAKRLRLERVEPPLSLRPHGDKARGVEDAQVTRHTRLVNPCPGDEVIDLLLTMPQGFH